MTVAVEKPEQPQKPEQPRKTDSAPPDATPAARVRQVGRGTVVAAILIAWLVLFAVLRGKQTLTLAAADLTDLHRWINDLNDSIGANRNSNPLFLYFFNEIRLVIDTLVTFIQELISQPSADRPLPQIGWLGVVGITGYVSWAVGNWRVALLAVAASPSSGCRVCGRRAWTRWRSPSPRCSWRCCSRSRWACGRGCPSGSTGS